jgi:photosystem II stability/assembly factor-like uncharacterized protein
MYDNNIWPGKFLDNGGFAHNVVHPDIGWDPTGVASITAAPTDPSEMAAATYLVPAGTYLVSASATIPAGAALVLARGAELKPGSGATLTIAAEITADPAQIFDLSGGGSVDLTGRALEGANPLWFGAPADGSTSDATATQALIDALPTTGSFLLTLPRTAGYVFGTGLSAGAGRTLYWRKEVGVTYTGKLPGTVLNDVKDLRRTTPQATYVFGAQPVMLPGVKTANFSNTIGAQASGTMTFPDINGISGTGDRVSVAMRTSGTGAFVLQAAEPAGPNELTLRMGNFGASSGAPGTRDFFVTVLENQAYRQVFALSSYLNKSGIPDVFLAGVDSFPVDYACIWRTENGGVTWYPVFGVDDQAIRRFAVLDQNRTRVFALSATTAKCHLSTDSGTTWTLAHTFAGETNPSSCALAGGEGSGSDRFVVGMALTGKIYYSTNVQSTPTFSLANNTVSAAYEEVREIVWLSGSGASAVFLAFMVDTTTGTPGRPPMVLRSTDGGANWSLLGYIMGDPMDDGPFPQVQCAIRLSSGTLLAGLTEDGEVYRSVDAGETWAPTFRGVDIREPYSKVRCFHQWTDGTVWMGMQNSGQLWRSDDDGRTWQREHDLGRTAAPFSMTGYGSETLLVGLGQGLETPTDIPYRATVTQFVRSFFNDQQSDHV